MQSGRSPLESCSIISNRTCCGTCPRSCAPSRRAFFTGSISGLVLILNAPPWRLRPNMGDREIGDIAHIIQLSVAPVFLLLAATIVVSLAIAASSQNAPITLPAGVKAVSFGQAQRYQGAGKEMCAIVQPLPSPAAFEHGVKEISYAVALEAGTVKSASARVVAPAGQELRAVPCNIFTP